MYQIRIGQIAKIDKLIEDFEYYNTQIGLLKQNKFKFKESIVDLCPGYFKEKAELIVDFTERILQIDKRITDLIKNN